MEERPKGSWKICEIKPIIGDNGIVIGETVDMKFDPNDTSIQNEVKNFIAEAFPQEMERNVLEELEAQAKGKRPYRLLTEYGEED